MMINDHTLNVHSFAAPETVAAILFLHHHTSDFASAPFPLFPLQADCVSKARHVSAPLQRPQGGAQGGGGGGCGGRGEEGGGGAGGLHGHHRPLQ